MNFINELLWRGLLKDKVDGIEEKLINEKISAYIGFDPTADSLHIGNLVGIKLLMLLQKYGHTPIALVGGATGMIGDPSGKSAERNLLDTKTLEYNIDKIKTQLSKFLDFDSIKENSAKLVNNYDWFKDMGFLKFSRNVGKLITVNYMLSKESVKKRIDSDSQNQGMSFTEFTYQLIQGYDFYQLYKNYNCILQLGGSDQWGNITTGIEMVRKIDQSSVYGITSPLVTKADGQKFGKTEKGTIWLDSEKTSIYDFYQFWLNTSDIDAQNYIKIFSSSLSKEEVDVLIKEHLEKPELRLLQKTLAEEVTTLVHSKEKLENVQNISKIIFSNSSLEELQKLKKEDLIDFFKQIGIATIKKDEINRELLISDLLTVENGLLPSKSEFRRALKEKSILINKTKCIEDFQVKIENFISNEFILCQRGKKNYFLIVIEN